VKKGARCQYTTIQNWYKNVYNLVTKRARVEAEGTMIWTDFNMGSKLTMKYPSFLLMGEGARGETLSMAMAGAGQHQDTGSKAFHLAPHTSSTIVSKSISKNGGRTSYRGMVTVSPVAHHSKNTVICDALILDPTSRSDTYPTDRILNNQVEIQHEATVSKIGDEQLFYLMSRGISEEEARKMIVNGFVDDLVRKLPLEYAVEMNRLIDHEMEGSVG
jgi:Fe-S cluster assembly protein SufB